MKSTSYDCSLCNFSAPTINLWLSHLRNVHSKDENFAITCGINECPASYSKCASFVSHVYRQHRNALFDRTNQTRVLQSSKSCTFDEIVVPDASTDQVESLDGTQLQHTVDQLLATDQVTQQKKSALYVLNLKDIRCLSDSSVNYVLKQTQEMFQHSIGRIRAGVNERLSRNGIDPEGIPDLSNFFDSVEQPFQGLHTSFLQEKFYQQHLGCIVSICICVQHRL